MMDFATSFFMLPVAAIALAMTTDAQTQYQPIVGYEPESLVTDHNAIDMDLDLMLGLMRAGDEETFRQAELVYNNGVYSKSYAELNLSEKTTAHIAKGARVRGPRFEDNKEGFWGDVMEDVPVGSKVLKVKYHISPQQDNFQHCIVGALGLVDSLYSAASVTGGCYAGSGRLNIGSRTYDYSYDIKTGNKNDRTLAGFSTNAEAWMYNCEDTGGNCPYADYAKFFTYYGEVGDYAHRWVTGAFQKQRVSFGAENGRGDIDFSLTRVDDATRIEAIETGTVTLSVLMFVIRMMEHALDMCFEGRTQGNDNSVHAWDMAVAFYAGSLEGGDFSGEDTGRMLFRVAEEYCTHFRTCGEFADRVSGSAYVNIEIMREFSAGQEDVEFGECASARLKKERIVSLMKIPLIQGALRFAHRSAELKPLDSVKAQMQGSTFAASVLPFVHACNEDDAAFIYEQMKFGRVGHNSFIAVHEAFSRNFQCMGVTCGEVGGVWNPAMNRYYAHADPCSKEYRNTLAQDFGMGFGIGMLGGLIGVCGLFIRRRRSRRRKAMKQELLESTSNLAPKQETAVTVEGPPENAFFNIPMNTAEADEEINIAAGREVS